MVLKEKNKVIGSIKMSPDENRGRYYAKYVSYVLSTDYWGKGYMTETLNRIIKYALEEMNIDLLSAFHFPHNNRSKCVLDKGYTLVIEVFMKKIERWKEQYGIANLFIVLICTLSLIINAFTVSQEELLSLSENKGLAFILNFLLADKGIFISNGSMSYNAVFRDRQYWRIFTNIYLHAGFLHMAFNMMALICVGRYMEKKIGSIMYAFWFNIIAMVDAILVCMIFPSEVSVGASAGIFGILGMTVTFFIIDRNSMNDMKKREFIFLIIFSMLSLLLGLSSFIHHLSAFVIGLVAGLVINKILFKIV